jgi:hypothetical protein
VFQKSALCHGTTSVVPKWARKHWALQAAEKPVALKGHDFSRAASAAESTSASAAEGCFSEILPLLGLFPQPVWHLRQGNRI